MVNISDFPGLVTLSAVDGSGVSGSTQPIHLFSPDSDADGMPDEWEKLYGFLPNDPADATMDTDLDGLTNAQEYLTGTDPRSAGSRLRISKLEVLREGVKIAFRGIAFRSYQVEGSGSLKSTSWVPVSAVLYGADAEINLLLPALNPALQFFRLRLVP
jgi:hypothetical protein